MTMSFLSRVSCGAARAPSDVDAELVGAEQHLAVDLLAQLRHDERMPAGDLRVPPDPAEDVAVGEGGCAIRRHELVQAVLDQLTDDTGVHAHPGTGQLVQLFAL